MGSNSRVSKFVVKSFAVLVQNAGDSLGNIQRLKKSAREREQDFKQSLQIQHQQRRRQKPKRNGFLTSHSNLTAVIDASDIVLSGSQDVSV